MTFQTILCQNKYPQNYFASPVDFPIFLSGNFGELRSDHFHSGIDIKTQGVEGKNIYAVADGYISRIFVAPGSYGRALYINHPNGFVTVYGHLKKFTEKMDDYVKSSQYERKSFYTDLFPEPDKFPVKKGDIIGVSGNTGSSGGPHLHFEIRDSRNHHPINPLLFNFDITDNIKPIIYKLILYPANKNSSINKKNQKQIFPVSEDQGIYQVIPKDPIIINGEIGFGIETIDYLNNSSNRCGVYSIELLIDSTQYYYHEIEKFSFSETRYHNSFIDYEEYIKSKTHIHKTFIQPNNKLSIYKNAISNGFVEFNDTNIHNISLIIKDVYHNTSELHLKVYSPPQNSESAPFENINYSQIMPFQQTNSFVREDIKLYFPKDIFYDTLFFNYAKEISDYDSYSPVFHIHNKYTPLHKTYSLSIKANNLPVNLQNKALIGIVDEKENELVGIGGEWNDGFVSTETGSFGKFSIVVDTIPPEIIPLNINNDKDLSNNFSIDFKVTDDLSGIKSYTGYIDNLWVLFEYDPKNDKIFYTFDNKRLKNGKDHELELYILDNKNNAASYFLMFYK